MTNSSATKIFSDRARASALAVRRHQSALGASDTAPVAMGGMMVSPAIAARVKQILAEKAKGKVKKAGAKPRAKKGPDPAKAKEKAARVAKAAAAKQEREKAKMARDVERTAAQAGRDQTRKAKQAERVAAQAKKQAAAQAKLKAAAGKAKAKAGAAKEKAKASAGAAKGKTKAAAAKQAQAQQHKTRVLSEKIKRGEKLSASDQVDAEDAGLIKASKAMGFAIKQSDEERAMFAKMGGGRGKGKGYDKSKSTLTTGKDTTGGGGAGGVGKGRAIGANEHAALVKHAGDSAATTAENRYYKFNHSDSHAGLYDTKKIDSSGSHVEIMNGSHIQVARAHQGKIKAARTNAERRAHSEVDQHNAEVRAGRASPDDRARTIARIKSGNFATKAIEDIDMDDDTFDTLDDLAIKAGARHSKMDASHLDEAARHLHAAGATCPDCAPGDDAPDDEDAAKAIKSIMDDPGYFAQHECNDVMQAASGLQTLVMLIQSELSEDDIDTEDINQLADAADTLVEFIQSELHDMRAAAEEDAKEDQNEPVPMAKALHAVKFADDDNVYGPAIMFGTKETPDLSQLHDFFTKSTDYWLQHWDRRPMLWHHTMPQTEILDEMKSMGAGADELSAMAEALDYLEDHPVVGVWTKATVDPVAVWMNGQLDRAHKYRAAVKRMIELGMLKISTDSATHLVRRERQPNGTHEVKRWPIIAASLTPTAAEPRLYDVQALKSFYESAGIIFPSEIDVDSPEASNTKSARPDGVEVDAARTRRLVLELDILQLEETAR